MSEILHWCDPDLHDGERVPADWLMIQAVGVDGTADESMSGALVASAGGGHVLRVHRPPHPGGAVVHDGQVHPAAPAPGIVKAAKPYNRDSVQRGLDVHERHGALVHVSPPGHGQPRWRVTVLGGFEPLELTLREAWILCYGLAAGRTAAQRTNDGVPS